MDKIRSTKEVFESHLLLRKEGKVEEDIQTNYSDDIVIISSVSKFYGHDGVRKSANVLENDIGDSEFIYVKQEVEQSIAYLVWNAESNNKITSGTDSFLIKDGKIKIQTIYYEVENK